MGDGEAGSEDGVALHACSHELPVMQEKAIEAINAVLVARLAEQRFRGERKEGQR